MDQATVFTKTAKGITQVNQRSASLSKDLMKVLKLIDGKSNFAQIMEKAELDKNQLEKALNTLTKDGFARIFQTKKEEFDPFGDDAGAGAARGGGGGGGGGGDDFDFTAPGKITATQRVVPGAANDIAELSRQHEKQDADRKAKEAAHAAASARARVEAQVRAKLEAEAKARQEAERQAMEQAQRAKEASERARAEVEAQKREEALRQKAIAEQQAKLTAEQQAKQEAESRRLAELRVKAEREAKALAEARARAEAEAAAMAKARAEAEAAAKKQAAEASNAQAEMKARLKDEIEARIRGEMEELLKNDVEEKTRESMKAEILAEAKLAAQAELEERLAEERANIAKLEAEARVKAEHEAGARADIESKKRAEAEARAKVETEARIRAEEETKKLRAEMEVASRRAAEAAASAKAEIEVASKRAAEAAASARADADRARADAQRAKADAEARARTEADARARDAAESEKRLEAERQAKYAAEARAKIEAEEREKRERELSATIEEERKAKQEAEARVRIEAKARETIAEDTRAKVQAELETDLTKKAEIEGKAQAKAYMQAKVKAEQDEEQKMRDDQARRAREIADVLRTRVEADEKVEAAAPKRHKRRGSMVKPALFGALALVVIAIGLLHVVPLRAYTAKVEKSIGAWLDDDVSIGSMTFRLVPTPHLRVENVAVGKSLDAKAASGRIDLDLFTLFGDKPSINSIELDNVSLTQEAVRRIPRWGSPAAKSEAGGIERIRLRGVKMETKPPLDPFDATLNFARNGAFRTASLTSPSGWTLSLKPGEKGFDFDASARNMNLPLGAPIPISDARFKGTLAGSEIVVPEFEADALEGKVNGTLRLTWGQSVKLESDLALAKVNVSQLVGAFTKAIAITGKLDGNFTLATEGPTLEALFASPRAQGKFKLGEGTISNVDLVAVMQSDSAGSRAGVTKFAELTGEFASVDHRASFKQVSLQGGVLRGSGNIDVGSNSNIAGRLSIEIRSQVASDRGAFSVSGTVSRPIIKRGG